MRYVGIDPGKTGAVAFKEYDEETNTHHVVKVKALPMTQEQASKKGVVRDEPDIDATIALIQEVRDFNPRFVMLEMQWVRCHDSAIGSFALGGQYKLLRGLLQVHGFPFVNHDEPIPEGPYYSLVAPQAWKLTPGFERWGLFGAGDDAKEVAIEMVRDLYLDDFYKICPKHKTIPGRFNKPRDGMADAILIARAGFHLVCFDIPFEYVPPVVSVAEEEQGELVSVDGKIFVEV